ncbi:MAG TPA: outer membrane protein assembly factor BamD [Marinobacter sp.]|nr:outer membrane protein assembly factor BamD [Marinobacter sp.]
MSLVRGVVLIIGLASALGATAQESFRVELGRDGDTLGDMRPVFLTFESRPLPAISPREVARRYKKLFETSDEPEVRIDALNRLNHIRDRSGQDLGFSGEQEQAVYREALASYERILASGSYSGRLDEMLYQMAKAYGLTGQHVESLQRLKQLVGLYPGSTLAGEARFRLAEAAYSAGQFAKAAAGYRAVLIHEAADGLDTRARYMLGWSQFKLGRVHWDQAADTFMALLDEQLPDQVALNHPPARDLGMIEDSFRILALMAARSANADTLAGWLSDRPADAWHHLMYDRLADLHAVEQRYGQGVAVHQAFLARYPEHPARAEFRVQTVEFWANAGNESRVWQSRQAYVDAFRADADFRTLGAGHQNIWRQYAGELGDHYYASDQWQLAAAQYEALAPRSGAPAALYLLAGDARLQARDEVRALANYRIAAYGDDDNPVAVSAKAGWAAIRILLAQLDSVAGKTDAIPALTALAEEQQRYTQAFGADQNLIGLRADLANRWLEAGRPDQALVFAQSTLTSTLTATELPPEYAYPAWLITARVRQQQAEFGLEERAWRQALMLAENQPALLEAGQNLDSLRLPLATAIYRQAEAAAAAGEPALAVAQFQRASSALPGSELAVKARFDAANTLFRASDWQSAINEFRRFRSDYPSHHLASGVSARLVRAYKQSGQPARAAEELLASAESHSSPWLLRHRAAVLFEEANALQERNALFRRWLAEAPVPQSAEQHVRDQRYRWRLIEAGERVEHYQAALVEAETASHWHTNETLQWAGKAALALGARAADTFAGIALSHPLEATLARKQQALASAQAYLVEAESLAGEAVVSEVLFRRAELYRTLARDLMASEPPAELNEMETLQYQMLLEEEAFPLEQQAMALHARNHQRIAEYGFDVWIGRSLESLATLHPGRYQRELRWMSWNQEPGNDV